MESEDDRNHNSDEPEEEDGEGMEEEEDDEEMEDDDEGPNDDHSATRSPTSAAAPTGGRADNDELEDEEDEIEDDDEEDDEDMSRAEHSNGTEEDENNPMETPTKVPRSSINKKKNEKKQKQKQERGLETPVSVMSGGGISQQRSRAAEDDMEGEEDELDEEDRSSAGIRPFKTVSSSSSGAAATATKPAVTRTGRIRKVPTNRRGRTPSVAGLSIPFRTVKKAMKLDPDTPIVQNEAAIMATLATELFLKRLSTKAHANASSRGRSTVRYEDIAEARTQDFSMGFLEAVFP